MIHLLRSFPFRFFSRGKRHTPAAFVIFALASAMCRADDTAVDDPRALLKLSVDELLNVRVTTVSREESTIGHSAAAIFVINPEQIRRSGATSIPELLRMVPGLDVARVDGNKWAVASRGLNGRFAKNLLVQVDGRTVYAPLTAGVFWETVDYPLADIERIEVVRGPGASLWGANAVNGIINIITKSSQDTLGGFISGGGGNVAQGFADFRVGGKIGDRATYRIFGKWFNQDRQFSPEGDPNDQWWRASGGVRLDWHPGADDTVTLDGGFIRSAGGAKDRFALSAGPPFGRNFSETQTIDSEHVLARWTHKLESDSSWTLQGYWDRFELTGDTNYRNTRWNTFDLDFQHQFALGTRQKIVWGLGYRHIAANLTNSVDDGGFSLSWLNNQPESQVISGFVQDQIALVPNRLSLMLGTKLEHNSFTGFEVQPSGRLLWTPTKRQSAWVSVSRAVRTPSFTEDDVQLTLPAANPANRPSARLVANRDLTAEKLWAYELGYRVQTSDAFSVDAALFYNVHDNLRANQTSPSLASTVQGIPLAASQFFNGLSGETYGAELTVNWKLTDWWRLTGSYTLLKANMHGDQNLPAASRVSQELGAEKQSPQQQVHVQSSWNIPGNVEFDLIGRFVDRLAGFNPTGIPGVSDTVSDYFTLDARLAWHPRRNLELAIVGQNLLDNHHPEFGTNPFVRSPLVEARRGVFATVTFKW